MKRRLFNILSALWLLLLVAVIVLWVRSDRGEYWHRYACSIDQRVFSDSMLVSSDGLFTARFERHQFDPWLVPEYERLLDIGQFPNVWKYSRGRPWSFPHVEVMRRGSHYASVRNDRQTPWQIRSELSFGVPYWSIAVGLLLPLAWVASGWRCFRRHHPGRCPVCGYDLRATPERCPECGTPAPAAAPQSSST